MKRITNMFHRTLTMYFLTGIFYFLYFAKTIDARVAGKVGGSGGNYYSGKI